MLSKEQIRKYDHLSRVVLYDIERREDELNSHLRLNYSMLPTLDEKNEFTDRKFSEVREILSKLEGYLADCINSAITEDLWGFDNPIKWRLINNVVTQNILEQDLKLILLDINLNDDDYEDDSEYDTENEHLGIDLALFGCENDYPILKEFTELMAIVSMFGTLRSFKIDAKQEIPDEEKFNLPVKNKSLLFQGKSMNLTERIKVANEILDFEGVIRKLNISESEKYQLMAYIMGNDVNNVRNRVNGTRTDKVREIDLQKYFENLMK